MPKCPNCNENVPKKQRFCGFCGTDITTGERPEDLSIFDSLGRKTNDSSEVLEESYFAKQRREAIAAGAPIVEKPRHKMEVPADIAKDVKGKQIDETELEMRMKGVWQQDSQAEKIAEKLKSKDVNEFDVAIANSKKNKEFLKDLPPIGIPKAPAPLGAPPPPPPPPMPKKVSNEAPPPVDKKSQSAETFGVSAKNPSTLPKNSSKISPRPEFNTIFNKPDDKPSFMNKLKFTANEPKIEPAFAKNSPKIEDDVAKNADIEAPKIPEKFEKPAPVHTSKFDDFDKIAPKKPIKTSPEPAVQPEKPVAIQPEKTVEQPETKISEENILKSIEPEKKPAPVPFEIPISVIEDDRAVEAEFVSDDGETVKVPNVVGITKENAQELISKIGLKAILKTVNDSSMPKGIIVSQDIPDGVTLDVGGVITLLVSVGDWSKWTKDPYISDEKHQIERKNIYRHRSREQFVEYRESDKNMMEGFDLYDSRKMYTNWEMDEYYSKENRSISDTCEILKTNTGFKYFGWIYHGNDSITQVYCSLESALLFNPRTVAENWEYNESVDRYNPEPEIKKWNPKGGFPKNPAGDDVLSNINLSTFYVGGIEYATRVGNIDTVWTKYRKRKLTNVTYLFKTERYSEWSNWSDWSLEQEIEPDDLHEIEVQTLFRRRRKADIQDN